MFLQVGDSSTIKSITNPKMYLLCKSYVINPMEKRLFQSIENQFLYKRVFKNEFKVSQLQHKFNLNFLHPTEWIAIMFKPNANNEFEYSEIKSIKLIFDGIERIKNQNNSKFYKLLQKYLYNDNCNPDNIYFYSFCLKPNHGQPSGSLNMSQIVNKELQVEFNSIKEGNLYVYTSAYNMLMTDGTKGTIKYY